jgi:hypothetical protein
MRRTLLVVVILTLAIAGLALADAADSAGMMGSLPMGMGADVAAYNGNVYVLQGLSVKELGADLSVTKTVDLPDPTADMQRLIAAGVCPACGGEITPTAASGDQSAQRRANMCSLCQQRMLSMTKLVADSSGVYVLRLGHLYVYDADLNLKTDAQVISPGTMKPTDAQMKMMDNMLDAMNAVPAVHTQSCSAVSAVCQTCRSSQDIGTSGSMIGSLSNPKYKEIPEGQVGIGNHPCPIGAGPMDIHIHINNAQEDPDFGATVTAYVYPRDDESMGHMVMLQEESTGRWAGSTTLPGNGPWEMAVRVKRAGMEDAVTWWALVPGCPIE